MLTWKLFGGLTTTFLLIATPASAATVNCPIYTEGNIYSTSSSSYTKDTTRRWFGLDDGAFGNTRYRAYIWWDLSAIPIGAAIENAKVTYGFDAISFIPSSRRVIIGIIPDDYASWNGSSLSSQFAWLEPGNSISWTDSYISRSTPGLVVMQGFRENGQLGWLIGRPKFGMAFRADESDTLFVEDTTILNAYRSSTGISVTYVNAPSLSSPGNGAQIPEGTGVPLQWSSVVTSGGALQYQAQFSSRSDFSANVTVLYTNASSWTIGVFGAGQRVYWRVRVEDKTYSDNYSNWSGPRYFDVYKPTCRILPGSTGSGTGTLTYTPSGTACNSGQMQCFDCGTSVSIRANPNSASTFERWFVNSQDAGTQNPLQLTANDQNYTSVTARFNLLPPSTPFANTASGITPSGFTANWNSANRAAGYRLDVSTSSGFASYVSGYQDLDVGNVTSKTVAR